MTILLTHTPTLRGTPTALLRAMTPQELTTRLGTLELQFPKTFKPQTYLERRYHNTAKSEMARIKNQLRTRRVAHVFGEPNLPRPLGEWPRVETGDTVEHEVYDECVVTRVSWNPESRYGLVHVRLGDGRLKAVHPSTIRRILRKGV